MTLYLSRLTINRYAPTRALTPLIDPRSTNKRADAHHQLIWSLFGDGHDRARDFLWRADGKGRFMTLSKRAPLANDLFCPPETKEFAPDLRAGDCLHFKLRANATKDRAALSRMPKGQRKNRRVDLVMDMLKHHQPENQSRAEYRDVAALSAARDWLARQGAAKGFSTKSLEVEDYSVLRVARNGRSKGSHGVLDLSGVIEVSDPEVFLPALATGFGRAKAWGCGLMLIRRAR